MENTTPILQDSFVNSRLAKFTGSELAKLMKGGSRPMNDDELAEEKAKGGKRKTIDTLFGDGAMTYIYEKVAEWLTGESKPQIRSAATDWGIENEADAVKYFEIVTGKKAKQFGSAEYKFYPYNDNSGCSPDGLVEGENAVIEVKCPFLAANIVPYLLLKGTQQEKQEWLKKNQYEYYVQTQFEMMCTKTGKCYFIVYGGADRMIEHYHRMVVIELLPDVEMQEDINHRIAAASFILRECIETLSIPNEIYK